MNKILFEIAEAILRKLSNEKVWFEITRVDESAPYVWCVDEATNEHLIYGNCINKEDVDLEEE